MRRSVALVTARAARGLDDDLPLLEAALRAAGCLPRIVDWDDPAIEWAAFDLALLRSTWDYTVRLTEFLAWVESASRLTRLLNPPDLVRWNTDKHYLLELARATVPIVPSTFIEPGEDAAATLREFLERVQCAEFVVKPAVGAGSRDTQRHARGQTQTALAQAQHLLEAGRSVLLQPYLDSVDVDGETALIYFQGQFSHAIRKNALLPPGAGAAPAVGLVAPERITPRTPGVDELRLGERVLATIPGGAPLYARVDLIRDARGAPTLLELELTEPSLYFAFTPGAAERFTTFLLPLLTGTRGPPRR